MKQTEIISGVKHGEIVQVYLTAHANLIGTPIIEDGKIIGGLELANKMKFIPLKWTYIYYDKLPNQLLITDTKECLLALIINFSEKVIFSASEKSFPTINYKEIIDHWKELNDDEDYKRAGGFNIPLHRSKHTLQIRQIGKGWKFSVCDIEDQGMSMQDFITKYVSLKLFDISNIFVSFSSNLNSPISESFFIGKDKTLLSDYLIRELHRKNNLLDSFGATFDKIVRFELEPNYMLYKNGNDEAFVNMIEFRIKNKIQNR